MSQTRLGLVLKRSFLIISVTICAFSLSGLPTAYGISADDLNSIINHTPFYDPNGNNDCSTGTTVGAPVGPTATGTIYLIGDSYLVGLQQHGLAAALQAVGFSKVVINAGNGRGINNPGDSGKGPAMTAIDKDKGDIQTASTIVMVLGTNADTYAASIPLFMQKINGYNPTAQKFWVNTGNLYTSTSEQNTTNAAIASNSTTSGYSVIDWHGTFEKNPSLYVNINDKTVTWKRGLHPSDQGYSVLQSLITSDVSSSGGSSSSGASSNGSASSTVFGSASQQNALPTSIDQITHTASPSTKASVAEDINGSIIYQYLIGKGLTSNQALGIIGNLQQESNFQADDSTERSWPYGGYGIVQWTHSPGRRQDLANAMTAAGIGDYYHPGRVADNQAGLLLGFELDYMWWELNHGYSAVLAALKQTTTIEDATKVIFDKYEEPGDSTLPTRINYAIAAAKKYTGMTGLLSSCNAPGIPLGPNPSVNEVLASCKNNSATGSVKIVCASLGLFGISYADAPHPYSQFMTTKPPTVGCNAFVDISILRATNGLYKKEYCSQEFGTQGVSDHEFEKLSSFAQLQPGDIVVRYSSCGCTSECGGNGADSDGRWGHVAIVVSYNASTDQIVVTQASSTAHPSGISDPSTATWSSSNIFGFTYGMRYVGGGL